MWTSPLNVPRTAAVSLVKVVTKAPELPQAASALQKTMQIRAVACSKIICKVRTLRAAVIACHNPVTYVLCGVIYIWILRYCIKNGMIGREGPESSLIQNAMNIWVWSDFEVHICGRINTKTGWIQKRQICYVWIELRRMNIYITIMILN